jgi:hypothetical protein
VGPDNSGSQLCVAARRGLSHQPSVQGTHAGMVEPRSSCAKRSSHREKSDGVLTALLFGLAASSALVIGAVAGAYWRPPKPLLAAALAFDLFQLIGLSREIEGGTPLYPPNFA